MTKNHFSDYLETMAKTNGPFVRSSVFFEERKWKNKGVTHAEREKNDFLGVTSPINVRFELVWSLKGLCSIMKNEQIKDKGMAPRDSIFSPQSCRVCPIFPANFIPLFTSVAFKRTNTNLISE